MLPAEAQIIRFLPNWHFTGTNYLITPVVAEVRPSRLFLPNPGEVESVFEVPLDLLLKPEYLPHHAHQKACRGRAHHLADRPRRPPHLQGITANLTRRFYDLALIGEGRW